MVDKPAYQIEHSVPHVIKKYVTYSDAGASAGTLKIGTAPKNSLFGPTLVQMATVGTAALTVGTASGTANNIVTAGDVNETVAAVTSVAGVGVLDASNDVPIYVKWAADTAGAAYIVVQYHPFGPNS